MSNFGKYEWFQNTDEVASRPELFVARERVGIRAKEFILALDEVSAFPVGEDIVTVDPSAGLGRGLLVTGIGRRLQWAGGKEIRDTKLAHRGRGRHNVNTRVDEGCVCCFL